jgi:hypothetical protein
MKSILFFSILATAGCGSEALAPPADDLAADDAASKADGQCIRRHHACTWGSHKCCTGYCAITGYGPGECVAPLADGAACSSDNQCKSANCQDYKCATTCRGAGLTCTSDGNCCNGLFCENFTYGPWTCKSPQPNRATCTADIQCESGNCHDYSCAPAGCVDLGKTCRTNGDCCGGFCNNATYAAWTCTALLAKGAHCWNDAWCASGRCTNYQCE